MSPRPAARSMERAVLWGLLPTALALLAFLGAADFYAARRTILSIVEREVKLLTSHASESLAAFMIQRRQDALLAAETMPLHEYLKNLDYGLSHEAAVYREQAGRHFARFLRSSEAYTRITFVDSRKRERLGADASGPLRDDLLGASAAPPPPPRGRVHEWSGAEGRPLHLTSGVWDDHGNLRGQVVLECDPRRLDALVDRARVGSKGEARLIRDADEPGAGEGRLASEEPVRGTPWRIRLAADSEEFLGPLRQAQRWMATFVSLAILGMLWMMRRRVRAIVTPIRAMGDATRRFALGDLDFRMDTPSIEELRVLGESFNDMAVNLKARTGDLESRVRLLTALREMEKAVLQLGDEDAILRACLKSAVDGLCFDRAALYWVDYARKEIVGRHLIGGEKSGLSEEVFRRRRIPLGAKDMLDNVVTSRQPALVRDTEAEPTLNKLFVSQSKTKSFVTAPILGKSVVFGVITADNRHTGRPLDEADRDGLALFCNAVGLALDNALLLRRLSESEARHRSVVENSPVAVMGLSREHRITTWNRGAEGIFGYAAPEIIGKPLTALLPPGIETRFNELLAEVIAKGTVRDFSIQGMTKAGKRLELSLSWGGALQDFWMNREWAVVIHDVTEARLLQQQLIRSEKLSTAGRLISSIAHELNNPIQGVVGYAGFLDELTATGKKIGAKSLREVLEAVNVIKLNALRCSKIVDNLLMFVRQGKTERSAFAINETAKDACTLLDYKLRRKYDVDVRLDLPKSLPRVMGDVHQVQQIFVNLISNACDAMARQRGPKILEITARAEKGLVRVEVADSGPGVPADLSERIFEAFYTSKPVGQGTGLGLAICRQIIREHGGRMGVDAREGGGACFWFELPAAAGKERAPAEPEAPAAVAGRSILVVDDEPHVRAMLVKAVQRDGNAAEGAGSYAEARRLGEERAFDLVITDLLLGDGSGLELYEQWPRASRPPFLFLTGDILNTGAHHTLAELKLPMLHKPVELVVLRNAVRAALGAKPA